MTPSVASVNVGFRSMRFFLTVPTPVAGPPVTRYILPHVTGEPFVSRTLPSVGVGYTGSPILRSQRVGKWVIEFSPAEEVASTRRI